MPTPPVSVFWFRRDLRLHDNHGLYRALKSGLPVLPVFIFDAEILQRLENKHDRRIIYIHRQLQQLKSELNALGSDLYVGHGTLVEAWKMLFKEYNIRHIFTNRDYEPYAKRRDRQIEELANEQGVSFASFKDQCIFEGLEIAKDDGSPYTVFTPYAKNWMQRLQETGIPEYKSQQAHSAFYKTSGLPFFTPGQLGFKYCVVDIPSPVVSEDLLLQYAKNRDYPGMQGTSRLGVHLRFGTISIRELAREANIHSPVFMNELIWRDFYFMILNQFPHVGEGHAFKTAYDKISWVNDETQFNLWCEGKTGYPFVDAGMRELKQTGFMHNRVRMVAASFLVKHLLIDWRWGEAWFAQHLLDYDFSANNGGWQWAAGCGNDAAPYFRIFNPESQQKKFDPDLTYIRRWISEWNTPDYPSPIIDHTFARSRCLSVYKKTLGH